MAQQTIANNDFGNIVSKLNSNFTEVYVAVATANSSTFSANIIASEAISANSFVNVYNNGGTATVRNANANNSNMFATGYVLSSIANNATGTVMFSGICPCTVTTPASQVWLSDSSPGTFTTTAPSASNSIVQSLGVAIPGVGVFFSIQPWVIL